MGPTWDDVFVYLTYLSGLGNGHVRLLTIPSRSLGYCGYFRVEVRLDGLPDALGEASFGGDYSPGARTMAGAAYRACMAAEETLAGSANIEEPYLAPRKQWLP